MQNKFDVIVIGGGHAGIEAAVTTSGMGLQTLLLTMDLNALGRPSCNPSIGGTAKGHIVKEIDALGGFQGYFADLAGLHFKMLNKSKGPAVWSPRSQIDKDLYPIIVKQKLSNRQNLILANGTAKEIIINNNKAIGVITLHDENIFANAIILTAGTFLNGVMFTGFNTTEGGRADEPSSKNLSDMLMSFGLEAGRLKTGTPPRISKESIDFTKVRIESGDENPEPFSFRTNSVENKIVCWGTDTNEFTHDILRTGFDESPLFQGRIQGSGPRYCPSIEDKINRFSDRTSHKILLEPEGLSTNSVYVNGFSSSLPADIQYKGLRSIPGLENANMLRAGYAIEYDFFFPYQLRYTLETKAIDNLYFAGQINGTSGYEEAAGQGLVAGINAALKIKNQEPFILSRSESYIGVLIDDLVNKSTLEPYRMFTSLAEYRLLLRQDNADIRLMKYAYNFELIDEATYESVQNRNRLIENAKESLKIIKYPKEAINSYLTQVDESEITTTSDIYNIAKRGKVDTSDFIRHLIENSNEKHDILLELLNSPKALMELGFEIKYEGYIVRQLREIKNFLNNEHKYIPDNFDYNKITSFSNEAREKLEKIRPTSLGQASRISGVSASDISILSLYLK